jgi:hypothetical protein
MSVKAPGPSSKTLRSRWLRALGLASLLAALLVAASAEAKVFHSKESALKIAFPGASRVDPVVLYLSSDDQAACSRLARVRCQTRLVRAYAGYDADGKILGHAFIDTHTVRSMPETLMLVISNEGTIRDAVVLAFHEPQDFLAPPSWLKSLKGRRLDDQLALDKGIDVLSGATMTANVLTASVRRILAIHRLKLVRGV